MERFQSRGRFVAGVGFGIPGMGYKNPRTGEIEGFEADLARAIAEKLLGARDRIDFVQVTDEERVPALRHDLVDMVVSQLTITPDRLEQVDFSIPYYVSREAIFVRAGSDIKGFDDLKGKSIVATASSVSLRRMRAARPDAKLMAKPSIAGCLEAVAKGEADAVSNDLINLMLMQKNSGRPDQYEIIDIGDQFDEKLFGVAVKKGSASLVDLLNRAIESLKASGEIDRLLHAHID